MVFIRFIREHKDYIDKVFPPSVSLYGVKDCHWYIKHWWLIRLLLCVKDLVALKQFLFSLSVYEKVLSQKSQIYSIYCLNLSIPSLTAANYLGFANLTYHTVCICWIYIKYIVYITLSCNRYNPLNNQINGSLS